MLPCIIIALGSMAALAWLAWEAVTAPTVPACDGTRDDCCSFMEWADESPMAAYDREPEYGRGVSSLDEAISNARVRKLAARGSSKLLRAIERAYGERRAA